MPSTNSTDGARSHARAQAATMQMRVPSPPPGVTGTTWAEAIPAGSYATKVLGRGTRLRLADPDGGAVDAEPAPTTVRTAVASGRSR